MAIQTGTVNSHVLTSQVIDAIVERCINFERRHETYSGSACRGSAGLRKATSTWRLEDEVSSCRLVAHKPAPSGSPRSPTDRDSDNFCLEVAISQGSTKIVSCRSYDRQELCPGTKRQ
jgi:hypothetical protein